MKISQENFITEIKQKNPKALEFAFNIYGDLVYKVVYSVLASTFDTHSMEECVNDIFLGIWKNIESFNESKGDFKHWLIAVSKYKAIDYRRKMLKQSNIDCIDNYPIKDRASVEDSLINHENREELLTAIKEMKDVDKEIFIRRYFLDEKIENIANTLGVNRSMVDNRLSRGRKFLKNKLVVLKGEII